MVDNPCTRSEDTEMVANIRSLERMKAAINDFQRIKVSHAIRALSSIVTKRLN